MVLSETSFIKVLFKLIEVTKCMWKVKQKNLIFNIKISRSISTLQGAWEWIQRPVRFSWFPASSGLPRSVSGGRIFAAFRGSSTSPLPSGRSPRQAIQGQPYKIGGKSLMILSTSLLQGSVENFTNVDQRNTNWLFECPSVEWQIYRATSKIILLRARNASHCLDCDFSSI